MEKKETFHYTYSAKEQEEIKAIRKKYTSPEEDKMEQLRCLDAAVTQKAVAASLAFGIAGALILGLGMSLAMTDVGDFIGVSGGMAMLLGIIIGIIGLVLAGMAYPLYNRIVKKEQEKIAPEIIRLTDELMR